MSDEYLNPDDEQDEAQRRIDQIMRGGGAAPLPPNRVEIEPVADDYETDAVLRARGRAQETRARLGLATDGSSDVSRRASSTIGGLPRPTQQALIWIGGLVGVGILIVVIIVVTARALGRGNNVNLPGLSTSTPAGTETLAVTSTTAAPTRAVPQLFLPSLNCIFQAGGGCSDYCAQPANVSVCDGAKTFVEQQGVKWDFWLSCVSPGPGPNTGDPQQCMRDGWLANNP